MEYRILGAGTFSVATAPIDDETGSANVKEFSDDYAQFPNYCQEQLDEFQFISLTTKAETYLNCWHDASEVTDLASCPETMAACSKALHEFETDESAEAGEEDEEEEVVEEEGEEEEEEEEFEEELDEYVDQDELFIHEANPYLDAVQLSCYYSTIVANLEAVDGSISSEAALEEGMESKIFGEITFHQPLRAEVSWLEFWLYMCNGDESVHENFDSNPLLASSAKAEELFETLNPDDGEEEEEERKTKLRQAKKVSIKVSKKVSKKTLKHKTVLKKIAKNGKVASKKLVKQH